MDASSPPPTRANWLPTVSCHAWWKHRSDACDGRSFRPGPGIFVNRAGSRPSCLGLGKQRRSLHLDCPCERCGPRGTTTVGRTRPYARVRLAKPTSGEQHVLEIELSGRWPSVKRVSDERSAECRQHHSDLMKATRMQPHHEVAAVGCAN